MTDNLTPEQVNQLLSSLQPQDAAPPSLKPHASLATGGATAPVWGLFLDTLFRGEARRLAEPENRKRAFLLLCTVLDLQPVVRSQGWLGLLSSREFQGAVLPAVVQDWVSLAAHGMSENELMARIKEGLSRNPGDVELGFAGVAVLALQAGERVRRVVDRFVHLVRDLILRNAPSGVSPAMVSAQPRRSCSVETLVSNMGRWEYHPDRLGWFWGIGYNPPVQQSGSRPELLYLLDRFFVLSLFDMSRSTVVRRFHLFGPLTFQTRTRLGRHQGSYPSFVFQEREQILYVLTSAVPPHLSDSHSSLNLLVYQFGTDSIDDRIEADVRLMDRVILEGREGFLHPVDSGVRLVIPELGIGEYERSTWSGITAVTDDPGEFQPVMDRGIDLDGCWGYLVQHGILVVDPDRSGSRIVELSDTWSIRDVKVRGSQLWISRLQGRIEAYRLDKASWTLIPQGIRDLPRTGSFVPDADRWCTLDVSGTEIQLHEKNFDGSDAVSHALAQEDREQLDSLPVPLFGGWRVALHNQLGSVSVETVHSGSNSGVVHGETPPWMPARAVYSPDGRYTAALGNLQLRVFRDDRLISKATLADVQAVEAIDNEGRVFLVEGPPAGSRDPAPGLQGLRAGWWASGPDGVWLRDASRTTPEVEIGLDYFANRWILGSQSRIISEIPCFPADLQWNRFIVSYSQRWAYLFSGITLRVSLDEPHSVQRYGWCPMMAGASAEESLLAVSDTSRRVFLLKPTGIVSCFSLHDGTPIWQCELNDTAGTYDRTRNGRDAIRVLTNRTGQDLIALRHGSWVLVFGGEGVVLLAIDDPFVTMQPDTLGITNGAVRCWIENQPVSVLVCETDTKEVEE